MVQTSPARCLLQAKQLSKSELTCSCEICLRVLTIKKDHKVAVLFVNCRSLWRKAAIEELWQWVFLDLMDLIQRKPGSRGWWHHDWIYYTLLLHLLFIIVLNKRLCFNLYDFFFHLLGSGYRLLEWLLLCLKVKQLTYVSALQRWVNITHAALSEAQPQRHSSASWKATSSSHLRDSFCIY